MVILLVPCHHMSSTNIMTMILSEKVRKKKNKST